LFLQPFIVTDRSMSNDMINGHVEQVYSDDGQTLQRNKKRTETDEKWMTFSTIEIQKSNQK